MKIYLHQKKFIYGAIKKGARAKEFEIAIQWLLDAGLVYRIPRISAPRIPLMNYEDVASFKLFMLDCGLLGALSNTPPVSLLLPGAKGEGKGSFTENFVCTQMETLPHSTITYFSRDDSQLEVDFVIQLADMVVPIEVKAEENLRSKSLTTFVASHPGFHGLRFSMSDYREQDLLTNVPLYAATPYLRAKLAKRQTEIDKLLASII